MDKLEVLIKAELGDFLYIIIFAILMLAGLFEKITKAKKPVTPLPPPSESSYDDFEDVENEAQPQTLEELMRRMMQTVEPAKEVTVAAEEPAKNYYQPITCEIGGTLSKGQFHHQNTMEEEKETKHFFDFEFDIRQAVIASEILNRKY